MAPVGDGASFFCFLRQPGGKPQPTYNNQINTTISQTTDGTVRGGERYDSNMFTIACTLLGRRGPYLTPNRTWQYVVGARMTDYTHDGGAYRETERLQPVKAARKTTQDTRQSGCEPFETKDL